jgi:hypothetical protein
MQVILPVEAQVDVVDSLEDEAVTVEDAEADAEEETVEEDEVDSHLEVETGEDVEEPAVVEDVEVTVVSAASLPPAGACPGDRTVDVC